MIAFLISILGGSKLRKVDRGNVQESSDVRSGRVWRG